MTNLKKILQDQLKLVTNTLSFKDRAPNIIDSKLKAEVRKEKSSSALIRRQVAEKGVFLKRGRQRIEEQLISPQLMIMRTHRK